MSAMESVVISSSAKEEMNASRRTRRDASEKERLIRARCFPSASVRRKIFSVIAARINSPNPDVSRDISSHCRSLARRVARPMR